MNAVFIEGVIQTDPWQLFAEPESGQVLKIPEHHALLPLKVWLAERESLLSKGSEYGVWLRGDQDPGVLQADLTKLSLVAINFPVFTDGRGFSVARLLRERYGYQGELRAIGQVLRDQVDYLRQCGFDSFVCSD